MSIRWGTMVQEVFYSVWPIMIGFSLFGLVVTSVGWFFLELEVVYLVLNLVFVIMVGGAWWRDIIRESSFGGEYTYKERYSLMVSFILFICSEVMLFFSFFWGFFHSSFSPVMEMGGYWPPVGVEIISPWRAPMSMTLILVYSSVTVNWSIHSLKSGNRVECLFSLFFTIIMGLVFSYFQLLEYMECMYSIRDGVYGSLFFLITGFHGMHVLGGTVFLFVQMVRMFFFHFSCSLHLGYEFSVLYWHFVDIIWLFVVFFLYFWGGWYGFI